LAVRKAISNYFGIEQAGTTWSREVVAELTTFVTMPDIVVVNPAVLKAAGIPAAPCFTYNIGIGVTAGLVLSPLCKLAAGRVREVGAGLWLLAGMSLSFCVLSLYMIETIMGGRTQALFRVVFA
jgi:xanthine/uracil/vitamin C permease (AzgA family)